MCKDSVMGRVFLLLGFLWCFVVSGAWGQTSSKVHEGFGVLVYGGSHTMKPQLSAGGGLAPARVQLGEETIALLTGAISSTSVWFGVFYWGVEVSGGYDVGAEYKGVSAGDRYTFEPEWNVELCLEAGVPVRNFLVYGKLGASFIGGSGTAVPMTAGAPRREEDVWALGYVLGGGLEFAFEGGFFVRGEYLFHQYAVREDRVPSVTGEAHSFRGGVGFRL